MLVAILTDIHGNAAALEAVLKDARRHAPDGYVFGGDLVANGPHPREALTLISSLRQPAIMGNMDEAILNADNPVTDWASQQIGPDGIDYLRNLPFSHRITPPGGSSPQDDLLVVHSTPRDFNDLLILAIPQVGTNFTRLTPADEAEAMLAEAKSRQIVYGHIHYFSEGIICGQRVMSIGSAGFPFDGDVRAAYALARWNSKDWQVSPVRVSYDHERVARDIEHSGQPIPERYAGMIRQASWLPWPNDGEVG